MIIYDIQRPPSWRPFFIYSNMNSNAKHISPIQSLPTLRVLGGAHSFHSRAARQLFPEGVELVACESAAETLDMKTGDRAVIAVENRLVGLLEDHLDLVEANGLTVVKELWVEVDLALAAPKGSQLADIRELRSHPVALAQCRRWLGAHPEMRLVEWSDTASALASLLEGETGLAAVGSKAAAEAWGLDILVPDIADVDGNATRFLLVEKQQPSHTNSTHNHMHSLHTHSTLQAPSSRWSSMIDLRPNSPSNSSLSANREPDLVGAHALARALEAHLEVNPANGAAELRWPSGGIHSDRLRDELYLRTGVLLDAPANAENAPQKRVQLPLNLPQAAYGEAAERIQKHAFYFWQRSEVTGTL